MNPIMLLQNIDEAISELIKKSDGFKSRVIIGDALSDARHFVAAYIDHWAKTVMQSWTHDITFMMQSVLIAAVRGPDGIRKDHPVKVLCRWLRRSFMVCAFEKKIHNDPYEYCGGSFTGTCRTPEVESIDHALELYLRSIDELPNHFQLHFMHAAEILGYKHPVKSVRDWWHLCYLKIVKDAHLNPETLEEMNKRLSDSRENWLAAEVVIAKSENDIPDPPAEFNEPKTEIPEDYYLK